MRHSSPSALPNRKSSWIQKCNKTHHLWLHSLILIFMSCCTNISSPAHRLIADLISHPGCSLGVLIANLKDSYLFWLTVWLLALISQTFLRNYRFFPENGVYMHARVCVCICIHVYFVTTPERLVVFFANMVRQNVMRAAVQLQWFYSYKICFYLNHWSKIPHSGVLNSIQRTTGNKALVQDLDLVLVCPASTGIARKCLSLAGYSASLEFFSLAERPYLLPCSAVTTWKR